MKILYVHQHFNTPAGSGGIRSYEFAKYFVNQGHSVHMVCGSYDGTSSGLTNSFEQGVRSGTVENIKVTQFEIQYSNKMSFLSRSLSFLKFIFKSIRLVLTDDFDIIYATSTPLTVGILGIIAKVFRRKKFIFEVRDLWPELPREMGVIKNPLILLGMEILESTSYYFADACVGLSPGMIEGIERKVKGRKPVYLIPNGCDNQLFANVSTDQNNEEKKATDLLQAGYFGTIGIANGLEYLLETAKHLKEMNINSVHLHIFGEGKLKEELAAKALEMNLTNISFRGSIPKKQVVKEMKSMDVGLMILKNIPAFYRGTSPNKFFDYIACGLPVVNNQPGWISDLIKENQCGFSASPESPKEMAEILAKLAKDKSQLVSMGKNAERLAVSSFDRQFLASKSLEALRNTMELP